MTTTKSPTDRHHSIDELDRTIVHLSARINAASYELLVLYPGFRRTRRLAEMGLCKLCRVAALALRPVLKCCAGESPGSTCTEDPACNLFGLFAG